MSGSKAEVILREALAALEQASVPEHLQAAALPEVMRLVAGASPTLASAPARQDAPLEVEDNTEGPSLRRLAEKVGVSIDVLSDLFYLEQGDLHLAVPSRKIASTKKEGTAELAVLVAVGRQGSGLDEDWTSNDEVRKWVQELSRYDSKHFGEHLQLADNVLTILGKGSQRRFRVKWNEVEQLRELILRVAGRG